MTATGYPMSATAPDLALVGHLASTLARRLPRTVPLDDLYSVGCEALVRSMKRFDRGRGVNLRTYAARRVHGAMLDELRRMDVLPRGHRRAVISGAVHEYLPHHVELSAARDEPDQAPPPDEDIDRQRLLQRVNDAAGALSPRLQLVLRMQVDGSSNVAIAEHLGVSQARVSQMNREAVRRLRAVLCAETEVAP